MMRVNIGEKLPGYESISTKGKSAFQPVSRRPHVPEHELLHPIASGAYGEVWLALSAVGTRRAVKLVHRDRHVSVESFEREFNGLQQFEPISRTHEGLVDILTLGLLKDGAGFYYVMELADPIGGSRASAPGSGELPTAPSGTYAPRSLCADLKACGALPATDVIALGLKLTSALAHLHAHGLVHRDVKPSNILFIGGEPTLADAGLVAAVADARSLVGTVGYIAPEGPGTPQADIYALGKVLYEAAFGKDRQEFPALPADVASRPDHARLLELNAILLKACDGDNRERYQSADQMRGDLELLRTGRSVKRRQAWQKSVGYTKKAALAVGVLVAVVASVVGVHLFTRSDSPGDGPPSTNTIANRLCDHALNIIRGDFSADFPKAFTNFNRAIELDPNFARAYAGLLELRCREAVPGLGPMSPEELRTIAGKLKTLAPHLAATYCAQAIVSYYDWKFSQAQEFLLKATKADPKYELAHTCYGFMLFTWGWPIKAREELERSAILKPSKVHLMRFLGHTYYAERKYAKALEWYRQAIDQETNYAGAYGSIGQTYQAMGNYTKAIDNYEQCELLRGGDASKIKQRHNDLRRALKNGGVVGYWEQCWTWAEHNTEEGFYWKAVIQIHLGNTNAAFSWLNKSFQTHERGETLTELLFEQCWDGQQHNPEFKKLLDDVSFSKVMPPRK